LIVTILNGLLPVIFTILLGLQAGRAMLLKHEDANVLATFVIRWALPLALFEGAVTTPPEKVLDFGLAACLTFGLMGSYLVAFFTGRFVFKHDIRTATMQALVSGYPDMAYFGAPILVAVIGPSGFLPVLVGNLVTSVIMIPVTLFLIHLPDKQRPRHEAMPMRAILGQALLKAVMNPIVWVPMLGISISALRIPVPGPMVAAVHIVGSAAGGTSLFALGLMLYGEKFRLNANVLANVGMKNFVQPLLMLIGVIFLDLTPTAAREAIITGAVPTATAAAMFALKSGTYTKDATSTILVSTVVGVFTAAGLIALLDWW
jgi:predicted permease